MDRELVAGEMFGEFRVRAVAGRGGMGIVYAATQPSLGRPVALKLLAAEHADDADLQLRFLREARLAATIDHPHVVPVYAAGDVNGTAYIAMQWIEGQDLRQLLAHEKRIAEADAVEIVSQLASAIGEAHRAALVHRDVKPANVLIRTLVGGRPHAYLTDFGVARDAIVSSRRALTAHGKLIGTAGYIAPELVRGEEPDERSDLYSLGCVLYELLSGRRPFERANETAERWAHANEPRPLPSLTRPELGDRFDSFFEAALGLDRAQRFPTAEAFVVALRGVMAEPDDVRVVLRGRGTD
jgi:serine/threonine protein kinase